MLRYISEAATENSRSEVFSAAFVVSYASLGVPALAAGLAATSWGLETTSYLYAALVGALSVGATLHAGRRCLASRSDNSQSAARTPLSVRQTA